MELNKMEQHEEKEYKEIEKELDMLHGLLKEENPTPKALDIFQRIVDLEIEAEKFCNQ
jgi:hypothetical protein